MHVGRLQVGVLLGRQRLLQLGQRRSARTPTLRNQPFRSPVPSSLGTPVVAAL
jgi:hypothetical protein